jgi:choline dehydrogenase-like flavoprotein
MEILAGTKVYDVCIVGSGAGGGMAAKVLADAGADIVMLEGGPDWKASRDSAMFKWPEDSPRRGGSAGPQRPFGDFVASIGGWEVEGEPYTAAPGNSFMWWRSRMLGGRTNHYGRVSLRFGPYDFKARDRDGLGDNWPISYDDIAPYYDKVDELVGIFGSNEGLPNDPDGKFQPAPKPRCVDLFVKQGCERLGIPCIPSRMSILTKPLNGRPACHYCGQCGRGCATDSNFSSPPVLLKPALETGRIKIVTGAMAREVTTDNEGRATGVSYVRTSDGQEQRVRAKVVVLAASACESARILLNSRSVRFPNGLANGSGQVGRNLTDSTGTYFTAYFPKLMHGVPHNDDGANGIHMYMPWWLDNRKLDFPRGYHIQFYGGRGMPQNGAMAGIQRWNQGGYGKKLKDDYREFYGSTISFQGLGEMIPNADTFCEIDPVVVDKWGIPVLRFHYQWSEYELKQIRHAQETLHGLVEQMGGVSLDAKPTAAQGYGITRGGQMIHEVGTTRMGDRAQTSVLNRNGQAHEVDNLFVADGGPFVSNADKNPTWTILALAWRTSEFIAEERRKGNL